MVLFVMTALIVGVAMLVMAVGVIFGRRCLSGSCGGREVVDSNGESLACPACSSQRFR